ncbi:MAG: hypothetical protein IJB33_02995 [Akkermansia sp.]|nr:hypothetical protein [Akkermansia sp.]
MKRFFLHLFVLLHLLPQAHAAGAFATAAEFGSPKLDIGPTELLVPSEMRSWKQRWAKPVVGSLVGLNPYSSPLFGIFKSPEGKKISAALQTEDPEDGAVVKKWKEENRIVTLRFYAHPMRMVRILTAYTTPKGDMIFAHIYDTMGETWVLPIPNKEVTPEFARSSPSSYYADPDTLKLLREEAERVKNTPAPERPLPVAESANEAVLYILQRGVSVVLLNLNRRGSTYDLAFRELLKDKKLVSAWAQRHVFLIAYTDDNGLYHPEHQNELNSLCRMLESSGITVLPPKRPDAFRGATLHYFPGSKVMPQKIYTCGWKHPLNQPLKHDVNLFIN